MGKELGDLIAENSVKDNSLPKRKIELVEEEDQTPNKKFSKNVNTNNYVTPPGSSSTSSEAGSSPARSFTLKQKHQQQAALSQKLPLKEPTARAASTLPFRKNLVQSHFNSPNQRVTCTLCNMSYLAHLKTDNNTHNKFHQRSLNGREWSTKWGKKIQDNIKIFNTQKNVYELGTIFEVNPKDKAQVNATKELLKLVNVELNAPEDTGCWLKGPDYGKVFIFEINKRAIGILSIERVNKGEWLILDSGKVVPGQQIPLLIGISRIYVVRNYRRSKIASSLLNCCLQHSVYGISLKKLDVGWSQPSEFGAKLSKSFNAVKHKSGKWLVPVYIETS
ncbi:hypothetical protein PACTADRAFT_51721 [Pachysolen tannophilus NRRL Y-2460]|uniref:N-acetyltransferase ECO1 n=1 Tax=Pachysolen tannophilus NRRL Y-2460 TaxID=669874 RepID=A0A1E4TQG0_PACTA|nr:hypothetical protein PACTADRAFT_51721 [Pachysolen tannophilus NRRL Y-2460]